MEKAFYVTNLEDLKHFKNNFSRIYFGQEFCQRLIPSLGSLKIVFAFAKERKLDFSLVTPYVTDRGLAGVRILLDFLKENMPTSEVVVNDWGVLNIIKEEYSQFQLVLGRLLVKQKRCPSLIRLLKRNYKAVFLKDKENSKSFFILQKKLPLALDMYYRGSNVSTVSRLQNFLHEQGIKRIELDNLGQGIFTKSINKLFFSLYYPYVYITTTFFCPTAGCDLKKENFLKFKPCNKQCKKYFFELRHASFPKVILLKGNTQFYKNDYLSISQLKNMGVNRLVFSPVIPV